MSSSQIRVVSFNMHGDTTKVPQFKKLLSGEQIICLQEVDDISGTRDQYRDYPYVFTTTNETTKGRSKYTSVMILSKVPFECYTSKVIQIDPGGDKWKRNAQYVVLKVDGSRTIHLFHYHNTYNWHNNNSASEREGLQKFVDWVKACLNIPDFTQAKDLILAGDFNLTISQGASLLLQGLNYSNNWVDYVCGSMSLLNDGYYRTNGRISDHDAPWAELDATIDVAAVVGPEVTIYNLAQREYLYAADYKPFDNDRRRVFTWRPGVPVSQGNWRIDDKGAQGKFIYNLKQGEYLYAADYKPFDNDRRRVFTWRPGNPVSQGYWRIE